MSLQEIQEALGKTDTLNLDLVLRDVILSLVGMVDSQAYVIQSLQSRVASLENGHVALK